MTASGIECLTYSRGVFATGIPRTDLQSLFIGDAFRQIDQSQIRLTRLPGNPQPTIHRHGRGALNGPLEIMRPTSPMFSLFPRIESPRTIEHFSLSSQTLTLIAHRFIR
jgi:hypothetical protein